MTLEALESWIRGAAAVAGLGTLAYAVFRMLRAQRRPSGREEAGARIALRTPVLVVATLLFILMGIILWRPLPIEGVSWLRMVFLGAGTFLLFGGLTLYLWGMKTLGAMFGPSSGFGVRLQVTHGLITEGPYRYVRHPMYVGVISTAIGTALLYRTWATLAFAVMMFGLAARARREEKVLDEEFGLEWELYASRVPPWFPRLHGRRKGGA